MAPWYNSRLSFNMALCTLAPEIFATRAHVARKAMSSALGSNDVSETSTPSSLHLALTWGLREKVTVPSPEVLERPWQRLQSSPGGICILYTWG